ncbi:MAG: Ig-like domain-containing protein, partial [Muribaculaceae bacterium]|nr:Ig-like domain-containing protein [Muribaculaceae bacterium]
ESGNELYIYKLNTTTGEYTMVNAKTYTVSDSGSVSVSMTKKATYELVDAKEAAKIDKAIKATIKPKKTSVSVKKGKKTTFTLNSKANKDNIKSITYTTSNKSVATVNKNGKITAKKGGTVTIKAKVTLKNGTTKTIKIKVKVK